MMKRFVAILILLIMPLQVVFAAAAEYCEVEKPGSGQHFGHHAHATDSDQSDTGGKDGKSKTGDSNCGFCHLGCAQGQVSAFALPLSSVGHVKTTVEVLVPSDNSPPGLDRPPRFPLA